MEKSNYDPLFADWNFVCGVNCIKAQGESFGGIWAAGSSRAALRVHWVELRGMPHWSAGPARVTA